MHNVIIGIISLCLQLTSTLFGLVCTYSDVLIYIAYHLGVSPEPLPTPLYFSPPIGNSLVEDQVYRSCVVAHRGRATWGDMILLGMLYFDTFLGIDYLALHHVVLDYYMKTVILSILGIP